MLLLWCGALSIFAFVACFLDKRRAINGAWRISEKTLLLSAVFGGALGLLAGMKLFRHKTRKWYFQLTGWLFLAIWIAAIVYALFI